MKKKPYKAVDLKEVREQDEFMHDHPSYHSLIRHIRFFVKYNATSFGWIYDRHGVAQYVNRGVVLVNKDMISRVL